MNDYIIDIVDIILVVVLGVPALILAFKQLGKKSFSYDISDTPIISINEKIDDVAVIYKGRPVENLRVVIVKVWNSGNQVIKEGDFSVPVSFCEEQSARGNSLVVAQVIDAPEAANAELYAYGIGHHSDRTALKKMLFNPGDSVTVKIIIADYGGENLEVKVTGRIAGIKAFKREPYVPKGILGFLYRKLVIPEEKTY